MRFLRQWEDTTRIYTLAADAAFATGITGHRFDAPPYPFRLAPDGRLTVAAGYSWNGCSPKIAVFDMVFGTPEGDVSRRTGRPKTYFASMVHDCLYQLSGLVPLGPGARLAADRLFYEMLRGERFRPAPLYYLAVRRFGGRFWGGA